MLFIHRVLVVLFLNFGFISMAEASLLFDGDLLEGDIETLRDRQTSEFMVAPSSLLRAITRLRNLLSWRLQGRGNQQSCGRLGKQKIRVRGSNGREKACQY